MNMAVTQSSKAADMNRAWHLIDATDLVLGRLASRSARILMGKHRPTYTPHADTGDFVVVINAGKVRVTGNKAETKKYYHHSGYPGGLKERAYTDLIETRPEEIIRLAVKRMLPKTKLGRQMIRKLKVYAGTEHPHEAQMPTPLDITKEL